jgi:ABC-type transport system substrate-binding protein
MAESTYWNRFWRRRISRRALLGAGAVGALGAASAAVLGCNGGGNGNGNGNGNGPDASGTPVAGGTVTEGRLINALGIDPHIDLTGLDVDSLMYTYLYSWNRFKEERVMNNLATNLETPDERTFLFTIRPDVVAWPKGPAAGDALTSTDCVESFKRRGTAITAPDKRFPQRIERYETPDDTTFNFYMSRTFVPAVREMANPTWAIVPAKVLDKYPNLSQIAFGNGPFMLKEFRGSERIVLERHPNYFLKPRPWLDNYQLIVITESSSLLAAFRGGQHDINGAVLTKSTAQEFLDSDKYKVSVAPSLFYPVVHMKMRGPWRDIRVREAMDLAINRKEIIDVIQDGEGNYNGPIQWPQVKWALPQQEVRDFYPHDPERAKALLKEAGHPQITAKVKYPEVPGAPIVADIAVLIKSQLEKVGINLELDAVELGAFIGNTLLPGNFDLAFFPNLPYDEPDRPLSFYHSKGVTGSGNWTNYTNPELDKLIDAQSEEFDEAKRIDIVQQAQRMILPEHGPQITMTGGIQYFARWAHVNLGPSDNDLETPVPGSVYGPAGADIWTDKR